MDTAIIISLIAVVISVISLGWNIYRDIVLKPRLIVDVEFGSLVPVKGGGNPTLITTKSNPRGKPSIVLTGVNHGPGPIRCTTIVTRTSDDRGGKIPTFLIHDSANPISSLLPCTIEPGQPIHLAFPYLREGFLSQPVTRIGIKDSFGRVHWAPRKSVAEMKKQYDKDFGSSRESQDEN